MAIATIGPQHNTWTAVPRTPGMTVLHRSVRFQTHTSTIWSLTSKIQSLPTRARADMQHDDCVDFFDTYAPVVQ